MSSISVEIYLVNSGILVFQMYQNCFWYTSYVQFSSVVWYVHFVRVQLWGRPKEICLFVRSSVHMSVRDILSKAYLMPPLAQSSSYFTQIVPLVTGFVVTLNQVNVFAELSEKSPCEGLIFSHLGPIWLILYSLIMFK